MLLFNLKKLRRSLSLSIYQLARIISCSPSSISKYENYTRYPSTHTYNKLAAFFGLNPISEKPRNINSDPNAHSFLLQLKLYRLKANISISELSRLSHISIPHLYRLEAQLSSASPDTYNKLADIFNWPHFNNNSKPNEFSFS